MTTADPTATALTDRLEAALGPVLVGTRPRPFGAPGAPLPVVRPGDRAALAELVGLARAEGLTLAPLGAGTKVDRIPPPPGWTCTWTPAPSPGSWPSSRATAP